MKRKISWLLVLAILLSAQNIYAQENVQKDVSEENAQEESPVISEDPSVHDASIVTEIPPAPEEPSEESPVVKEAPVPVIVNGDTVEYFEAEKKVVGSGNVIINYRDIKLTCDRAIVYTDTKDAVLEGNVTMVRGKDTFKGDRVVYNFDNKKGKIINARAEISPWYSGCEELEKVSDKEYVVRHGYISTCDRIPPHYSIKAKHLEIYPDEKVVAKNALMYVGVIPVLFIPYYIHSLKERQMHITLVPGRNKDWGWHLLTAWVYDFSEQLRGLLRVDYRQLRGFGFGGDIYYKTKNFGKGVWKYYFARDDRKNFAEEIRYRSDRWRLQVRHMQDLDEKTQAVVEGHKYRDDQVIKDFFYRQEYERDPHPESYVSVIRSEPYVSLSALTVKRLNDFDTVTERLPDLKLDIKDMPIFNLPLHYKSETSGAYLKNRYSNSPLQQEAARFDTDNRITYNKKLLGFLSLAPYVGTRQTFYSRDIDNDKDELRNIFYTGVDASIKFYKIFDVQTDFLGLKIDKLRHIFTPTANYIYMHEPTILPEKLYTFDDIDKLDTENIIRIGVENKLQAKRGKGLDTVDLIDMRVFADYKFRGHQRGEFLYIHDYLEARPYDWLRIEQDARFNTRTRRFELANIDVIASGGEKWDFGLGHRYEEKETSQITTQLSYQLTPKWKISAYERVDFRKNRIQEQEYRLTRDLHCWLADVSYNISKPGGHTIWFTMRLKAFPSIPISLKTGYRPPKPD